MQHSRSHLFEGISLSRAGDIGLGNLLPRMPGQERTLRVSGQPLSRETSLGCLASDGRPSVEGQLALHAQAVPAPSSVHGKQSSFEVPTRLERRLHRLAEWLLPKETVQGMFFSQFRR